MRNYGYPIHLENYVKLKETSTNLVCAVPEGFVRPEEINPTSWFEIKNQYKIGSCSGNGQSAVCEMDYYVAEKSTIKFSAIFSYYSAQKICGLTGEDNGATIYAAIEAAKKIGVCPLELMPYPDKYQWELPKTCIDAASKYKIGYHKMLYTPEDVLDFLALGQGGVILGIVFNDSCEPNERGIIERYTKDNGGGHCMCILGYTKETDSKGRPYYWMANSWGRGWGLNGWAKVSYDALSQMFDHKFTVVAGMSSLTIPMARTNDFKLW